MPLRPCYFIVHDDGSFYRINKRTFYRILEQRDDELHPEFAGQRVKYAEISVSLDGYKRPLAVHRTSFGVLAFDQGGKIDDEQIMKIQAAVVEAFPRIGEFEHPELTDARAARANEEVDREFGWEPSPFLVKQLCDAALTNKLVGGTRQ